jgi:hypothetical protein
LIEHERELVITYQQTPPDHSEKEKKTSVHMIDGNSFGTLVIKEPATHIMSRLQVTKGKG